MDPKPQSQNLSAIPKVSGKGVPPPPKDLLPKTAFFLGLCGFGLLPDGLKNILRNLIYMTILFSL